MSLLPILFPVQVNTIYAWDCLTLLHTMKACGMKVNCVVTSPPYWMLRDYGIPEQIGREATPGEYVQALVTVFRTIREVLTEDGTVWLNLSSTYAGGGRGTSEHHRSKLGAKLAQAQTLGRLPAPLGYKNKDLIEIPHLVALALQADGWYLRSTIIWHKENGMPASVSDRPTCDHEYVFLLTKSPHYYYDANAIAEPVKQSSIERARRGVGATNKWLNGAPGHNRHSMNKPRPNMKQQSGADGETRTGFNGRYLKDAPHSTRNKRTVWTVNTVGFKGAHFATFPPKLVEPMILAGCPVGGVVFDPFMGSGTVALVARELGRRYLGSELNPEYVAIAQERLRKPYRLRTGDLDKILEYPQSCEDDAELQLALF